MMIKTFADAGFFFAMWRGDREAKAAARAESERTDRRFFYSDFVLLEILPKAEFFGRIDELTFYRKLLARPNFQKVNASARALVERGRAVASRDGLNALDGLHVAAAELAGCSHMVTTEGKFARSSLHRVRNLSMVQIREKLKAGGAP